MHNFAVYKSKNDIQERRESRMRQTAEVFTPPKLVAEILSHLPDSAWEEGKTFCDPACGNGNMLVQVLWNKIEEHGHDPSKALESIYGVDIMGDNIEECRARLLNIILKYEQVEQRHLDIVAENIVWLDQRIYPKGALDYDFSFGKEESS